MLHFIPNKIVPAEYQGVYRKYWNECVSIILLFISGSIFGLFREQIAETSVAERWVQVSFYLHGQMVCPLCGGTRSFVSLCGGDILSALHYSFFGTFIFFVLIFHFVVKFISLKKRENNKFLSVAKGIDRYETFLLPMFVFWGVQLLLHYTGIFKWYVLN